MALTPDLAGTTRVCQSRGSTPGLVDQDSKTVYPAIRSEVRTDNAAREPRNICVGMLRGPLRALK
jgi:hypothetical protein